MPDVLALRAVLDGEHAEVRDRVRSFLERPELAPVVEIAREDYREQVLAQAKLLAQEGGTSLGFPAEYGGGDDIGGSLVALETLAHGDLSLMVKCGVQFGLYGGAILHLGSKHHHESYLRDMLALDLPGCFAMTETGHGSNVQSLRTTATYDPVTQEFSARHARRRRAQGLHRQRGQARALGRRLRPARRRRRVARRARARRPDPRQEGPSARRRAPGGLRAKARAQRRRQRTDLVRRRAGAAGEHARPLRTGHPGGRVPQPDREPQQALLHDARDADPGARVHRRRVQQRRQERADDRHALRQPPSPVRPARGRRGHADELPDAPAAAAAAPGDVVRAALRAGQARRRPAPLLRVGRGRPSRARVTTPRG